MSYRSVKGVSLLLVGGLLGCLPLTASAQDEGKYGAPRPWSGGQPAGPFSAVDLRDGNLFTSVPLVSFAGRGPSMHMVLYHNASTVDLPSRRDGSGWLLGDGWSMSYGARLDLSTYLPEVLLIDDDGTSTLFWFYGTYYASMCGAHNTLEELPDGTWKLTYKDQSYRIFASDGLLESVVDSSGNTLTVSRDVNRRIESVVDAAGRRLVFSEIGQGAGLRILDEGGPVDNWHNQHRNNRWWDITCATGLGGKELQRVDLISTNGVSVRDVQFGYDVDLHIDELLDADSNGWSFEYNSNGSFARLVYPASLGTLEDVYDFHTNGISAGSATRFTDRRGNDWWYEYEWSCGGEKMVSMRNPLGHTWYMAWDANHNMTSLIEPSPGGTWTYTYDSQGNLLTASDPIPNTTTYTYDSYNNLRSVTDPLNNQWQYFYESTWDPTLLTRIVEPDDGEGNGTATTNLVYYASNDVLSDDLNRWPGNTLYGSRGSLEYVEDPNGVVTSFQYDRWGQLSLETEGNELSGGLRESPRQPVPGSVDFGTSSDSAGRIHLGSGLGGFGGDSGSMEYGNDDATDEVASASCPMIAWGGKSALAPVGQQPLGPYPTVPFDRGERVYGSFGPGGVEYARSGRLLSVDNTVNYPGDGYGSRTRTSEFAYDALGRVRTETISTNEVTSSTLERMSTFTPYDQSGYFEYQTEDGTTLHVYMDEAGQVDYVQKGSDSVAYTYRPDGRLDHAEFAGGLRTDYYYYVNGAIQHIVTTHSDFAFYQGLSFEYDAAGRLTDRKEHPSSKETSSWVTYEYDNRGRLVAEMDFTADPIHLIEYSYDNGGNRKSKEVYIVLDNQEKYLRTDYFYDVDADTNGIETYGSKNNRLIRYEVSNGQRLETVWYVYNRAGNVSRILSQREGSSEIRSTRFEYDGQGQVWRVLADKWNDDSVDWEVMTTPELFYFAFGLTDEAMTWHEAKAFAESRGAELAFVDSPFVLQWLSDNYSPTDGQETSFWLGGEQDPDSVWFTNYPENVPWAFWVWDTLLSDGFPVAMRWKSEPDAGHATCPLSSIYTNHGETGGWLPGQPDDGGQPCLVPPDVCSDCRTEDHMVLTLNAGNVPGVAGLADANSSGLYRALLIADAEMDPVLPGYERLWAMEYRFSSPRQRYYWARLDPNDLDDIGDINEPKIDRAEEGWTDYFGDSPLVDYHVESNYPYDMVNDRTYLFGAAETDAATGESAWRLNDHLGTAFQTVVDDGQQAPRIVRRDVYSAFGELIYAAGENAGPPPGAGSPYATRYGYAGAHGYQQADMGSNGVPTTTLFSPTAHQTWAPDGVADNTLGASPVDGFPFLHLGHRLYDPATGRFLQRDPIGIRGGLNVYAYCGSAPVTNIDPGGDTIWSAIGGALIGGVVGAVTGGRSGGGIGALAGGVGGAITGFLIGSALVPPPAAAAIGGAVSGALAGWMQGYANGESLKRRIYRAIGGGVIGGLGGFVGGYVGSRLGLGKWYMESFWSSMSEFFASGANLWIVDGPLCMVDSGRNAIRRLQFLW